MYRVGSLSGDTFLPQIGGHFTPRRAGEEFIQRMRDRMKRPKYQDEVPSARRLASLDAPTVIAAVARYYDVSVESYRQRRSRDPSRDLAAWLTRAMTTATLRELMEPFGLSHPDSVSNLVRRAARTLARSKKLASDIATVKNRLLKTGNRGLTPTVPV